MFGPQEIREADDRMGARIVELAGLNDDLMKMLFEIKSQPATVLAVRMVLDANMEIINKQAVIGSAKSTLIEAIVSQIDNQS